MATGTERAPPRARDVYERYVSSPGVVTISPGRRERRPLFCVHAEAGDVSLYERFAGHLPDEQPVLGLCAPTHTSGPRYRRLEQIAAHHVGTIRAIQPHGPYLIVGECTGGALAHEIARQLRVAGEEIGLLAFVDAFAPGHPRLRRYVPWPVYRLVHRARIIGFHARRLALLDARGRRIYIRAKLRRAREALVAKASDLRRSPDGSHRQQFRAAVDAYDPRPASGAAVVFRASKLPVGVVSAPDLGWGTLIEHIGVETIPGYFTTPISEPGARILAQKLSRYLPTTPDDRPSLS
jgi:acetoacetyl-CoA synthetase